MNYNLNSHTLLLMRGMREFIVLTESAPITILCHESI